MSTVPGPGRPSEYPIELRSIHINADMQAFLVDEMDRRRGRIPARRLRNSVIRDTLRFVIAHHALFLSWVSTHGEITTGRNDP